MAAVSVWAKLLQYQEKKNSALGLPCLACFARPGTWKHHSFWSVSAVTTQLHGALLKSSQF